MLGRVTSGHMAAYNSSGHSLGRALASVSMLNPASANCLTNWKCVKQLINGINRCLLTKIDMTPVHKYTQYTLILHAQHIHVASCMWAHTHTHTHSYPITPSYGYIKWKLTFRLIGAVIRTLLCHHMYVAYPLKTNVVFYKSANWSHHFPFGLTWQEQAKTKSVCKTKGEAEPWHFWPDWVSIHLKSTPCWSALEQSRRCNQHGPPWLLLSLICNVINGWAHCDLRGLVMKVCRHGVQDVKVLRGD